MPSGAARKDVRLGTGTTLVHLQGTGLRAYSAAIDSDMDKSTDSQGRWVLERRPEAEILSKKNPPTEGGLNPILVGVGGDELIMLHCAIFRQSSFVMRCITAGNGL